MKHLFHFFLIIISLNCTAQINSDATFKFRSTDILEKVGKVQWRSIKDKGLVTKGFLIVIHLKGAKISLYTKNEQHYSLLDNTHIKNERGSLTIWDCINEKNEKCKVSLIWGGKPGELPILEVERKTDVFRYVMCLEEDYEGF